MRKLGFSTFNFFSKYLSHFVRTTRSFIYLHKQQHKVLLEYPMRPKSTSFTRTLTWLSPPSLLSSGDRLQDNNDVQPRPSTTVTRLLVLFSASLNSLLSNRQLTSSLKNMCSRQVRSPVLNSFKFQPLGHQSGICSLAHYVVQVELQHHLHMVMYDLFPWHVHHLVD